MINGTEISNGIGFSQIEIIIALGTIATAIILGITLYLQIQNSKPKFRFYRNLSDKRWTIVFTQSDKLIQKLTVELDGELLHERDTNRTEFNLGIGEAVTLSIPENVKDDSEVIFKYDNNKLKTKFSEIPRSR